MKAKGVRIHGKNDLRLEEYELPEISEDEILARVVTDSVCMSSYKGIIQGTNHKRIPKDVADNPTVIGHEFCGEILEVGEKWKNKFKEGEYFVIQPALNIEGCFYTPGYSYPYCGGDATYIVIPGVVMECNCLLHYDGKDFFSGSLTEPYSCVIGTFHAMYHGERGVYTHTMGIKENGRMTIFGGAGPMGLAAIDYIIHCDRRPKTLIVTDINQARLDRAKAILTPEDAKQNGVTLKYINPLDCNILDEDLIKAAGGKFNDILIFTPDETLIPLADKVADFDACINFFAGPADTGFSATLNFYSVHYNLTHVVGTSGGNTEDMIEAIEMMSKGIIHPENLVTHIGGLDCAADTIINYPSISGGKKLIYTGISLPLISIDDILEGKVNSPLYSGLKAILEKTNGLWCSEAEVYLLSNAEKI